MRIHPFVAVKHLLLLVVFVTLKSAIVTNATFSIAATDDATLQVGGAGASCVPDGILQILSHVVPGHGVLHTQALPPPADSPVYPTGIALLENDTDPAVIIAVITDPALDNVTNETLVIDWEASANAGQFVYDPDQPPVVWDAVTLRQHGCVDLMGRSAAYTGENIKAYYFAGGSTEEVLGVNYTQEHFGGKSNEFTFSAQGNIVTDNTVPTLVDTFTTAEACDLADRLYQSIAKPFQMNAQASGSPPVIGDVRCFGLIQDAALSIFLHVYDSDGTSVVNVESFATLENVTNPFPAFQQAYETWRAANPCGNTGTNDNNTEGDVAVPDGNATQNPGPSGSARLTSSLVGWSLVPMLLYQLLLSAY